MEAFTQSFFPLRIRTESTRVDLHALMGAHTLPSLNQISVAPARLTPLVWTSRKTVIRCSHKAGTHASARPVQQPKCGTGFQSVCEVSLAWCCLMRRTDNLWSVFENSIRRGIPSHRAYGIIRRGLEADTQAATYSLSVSLSRTPHSFMSEVWLDKLWMNFTRL